MRLSAVSRRLVRSNASSLTTRSLRLPAIGDSFIACGGLHFPPDVDYSCPSMDGYCLSPAWRTSNPRRLSKLRFICRPRTSESLP